MLAVDVPYEANTSKLSAVSLIYDAVLLYACSLVRINIIYLHHTKITLENMHVHTLQERYGFVLRLGLPNNDSNHLECDIICVASATMSWKLLEYNTNMHSGAQSRKVVLVLMSHMNIQF